MEIQILNSKIFENNNTTPLLIFHGLFGMLDNWATLGKRFAEKREVHLLDLRNHGRSFHSDEMSYAAMAEDITNYLDFHQIPKAILLGHSLGGKAVMECSIKNPERVEKLIVVDIATKAYPPHHQAIIKALQSVDFNNITDRKQVEETLSQYIHEVGVIQFLMKSVYRKEDGSYGYRFNLKTLAGEYNQIMNKEISYGKFENPTLFISGEKSNYILSQDQFYIKQQFPNVVFETIKNAAHWVQADNPNDFYEVVDSFLEQR